MTRHRDEQGYTVIEITVASAILMVALVGFFTTLVSLQNTSRYQAGRSRALDDLRISADTFSKDTRHASEIVTASQSQIVMNTYIDGVLKQVTYRVVNNSGQRDLERVVTGGTPRLFVIRLTDATIFKTDNPDPAEVRVVTLEMESQPTREHPAVVLHTEVALRNVRPT